MPELPEMQALAERLDALAAGAEIGDVSILQFSAVKTYDPSPDAIAGLTVGGVARRGKFLVFELGGPRMLIHLSQGGRVDVEDPPRRSRPKGGVARIGLRGRPSILVKEYGTQRKAGMWIVRDGDDGPLARLGPEPDSEEFERFMLEGDDGRRLHTLLRDQSAVAGIGRGYADDILHDARRSPYATLRALSGDDRAALLASVRTVLERALRSERSRSGGLPAKLSGRFEVHGRAGRPCPRCRTVLRRVSYEDYEICYCPTCQTGGKVLADRRLSRLIR